MAFSQTDSEKAKVSHWAKVEERGIIWGMHFLLKVYLLFGRNVLQVFLYPVVSYYWLINTRARKASRQYLEKISSYQGDPAINVINALC